MSSPKMNKDNNSIQNSIKKYKMLRNRFNKRSTKFVHWKTIKHC